MCLVKSMNTRFSLTQLSDVGPFFHAGYFVLTCAGKLFARAVGCTVLEVRDEDPCCVGAREQCW